MLAINLYYLYLRGRLIVRPQRLTLGRAAGAASGGAATAAAATTRFCCLGLVKDTCEALRLPNWEVWRAFLVFWLLFWLPVQLPSQPSCAGAPLWLPRTLHASPLQSFPCRALQQP
jgi:hypothetical protein